MGVLCLTCCFNIVMPVDAVLLRRRGHGVGLRRVGTLFPPGNRNVRTPELLTG